MSLYFVREFSRDPPRQIARPSRIEAANVADAAAAYIKLKAGGQGGFDLVRVWLEGTGEEQARNFDLPRAIV